ncbi:hypothetical protein EV191_111137 [Tamaricihabitans halophyticus]|uniref:Uncharacterized protein n=1 Tax=Tamaricihabitans halophyticus TaxID=1262583 RepID=A0A4R2QFL1_9PSEU|nr:hypothetical protein [Tamaricihabitans halophyticus]TCP47932.1 hypothetical protein EV191_111137 [Tamaricihabitans halophyticus]
MASKRPWVLAGAAAVAAAGFGIAGFTANADDVQLNDQRQAPIVQTANDGSAQQGPATAQPDSPESADSPQASPVDSANSPADTPGESADSPAQSAVDSPANSPADSPNDQTDSPANSPANSPSDSPN